MMIIKTTIKKNYSTQSSFKTPCTKYGIEKIFYVEIVLCTQ